jgi:hypothetical protein
MSEVDYEWVKEQLTKARTRRGPGDAVIELLKTWEQIDIPEELESEAAKIFASLAQGHALVAESDGEEVWAPAQAGKLKVADQIRVKSDAFTGSLGKTHNGRRGVVIAIRYGDIIVNSTDNRKPKLEGSHYAPHHLEKRVK